MSQQSTETEQPTVKRADALEAGDHVIEQFDGADRPTKVLVAQPYRNGDGTRMVSLMLDTLDGLRPLTLEYRAERMVELADEQDLAAFHDTAQRQALAKALHQLAADIVERRLPIPQYRFEVGGVLATRADLEAWAEYLGAEVAMGGGGDIPVVRHEAATGDGPVLYFGMQSRVEPQPAAEPEPEPEPVESEQEWLFTFGAGQQHDGRFVRITGTEVSARKEMNRIFGYAWCDQYTWQSFDAAGLPARTTELPESEWPPHAEAAEAPTQRAGE